MTQAGSHLLPQWRSGDRKCSAVQMIVWLFLKTQQISAFLKEFRGANLLRYLAIVSRLTSLLFQDYYLIQFHFYSLFGVRMIICR